MRAALSVRRSAVLGKGGSAPETLAAAVAVAHLHDASTFAETLGASLRFAGPANHCPVLVGSIGGARWGAAAIPGRLLDHCNLAAELYNIGNDLARSWRD